MSSTKERMNNKKYISTLKEVNLQKKLEIFSPEIHPRIHIKKIFLDCISLNNIVPKQINTTNKKSSRKKSHSLYKNPSQKSQKLKTNIETQVGTKTQNKKKIIINCIDIIGNNKKEIPIIKKNKQPKLIMLSNGSTSKSSDASPVENVKAKKEIPQINQLNQIFLNPSPKTLLLNNCFNLKKQNNDIKINTFKNTMTKLNKSKSKSKDKENSAKNRNNIDVEHTDNHPHINTFLKYNKSNCNTDKKDLFFKSACSNKIEPLKLFDNDQSVSSSSIEVEGVEEYEFIKNVKKARNIEEIKEDKEYEIDSKLKKNEGELSEELDDNVKKKDKKEKNKEEGQDNDNIQKIIRTNDNNNDKNDCLDFDIINTKQKQSCKNIISKLILGPNRNQISNKNIIISSLLTKAGICDDKEKVNQDSYIIIENLFYQPFNIYGVFDGHGHNGHLISKFISDFMHHYYHNKFNYYLNEEDMQNLLTKSIATIFAENHEKIIKKCSSELDKEINIKINYDISQSGSTSIMIFLINDTLICSNVGDSQCFLFNCSSDDLWTFEPLSKQHLPSDIEEQKRIIEKGGDVHPYYDEFGVFEGPDRIYAKNKIYPGLSMSRTIGDLEAKKIGVISTPDVTLKKINCDSKFLVIGSDGLWDVIKPYDIIRMIRPFFTKGDIEGACQVLMKKAVAQWDKNVEERDDITIIVVFIGTPNNYIIKEKHNFLDKIEEIENDDKEFSSKKLLKAN